MDLKSHRPNNKDAYAQSSSQYFLFHSHIFVIQFHRIRSQKEQSAILLYQPDSKFGVYPHLKPRVTHY